MRQLSVFLNDIKVGQLTEQLPGKGYQFVYDPMYVTGDFPHVSVTLPKTVTPYESDTLFPFFANMLPEGTLRRVVCREHHVDENDLFGILCAMADADSIGAVNLKTLEKDEK